MRRVTVPAIQFQNVRFGYGEDFTLNVRQLELADGERAAVVGPSGSGKTTLLHLAAGIEVPDDGCIRTCGVEVSRAEDAARRSFRIQRVGLVFQEFELLGHLSVLDNVLLPQRLTPKLPLDAAVRQHAHSLLERTGLADKAHRLAERLSQGERQRVAVCRALATRPGLVLADEPTGNLDAANKTRILDLLLACAEEAGAAVLVVTHDRELLPAFDRSIDVRELS
jgi:putative ABC transport system ATP-binding protein